MAISSSGENAANMPHLAPVADFSPSGSDGDEVVVVPRAEGDSVAVPAADPPATDPSHVRAPSRPAEAEQSLPPAKKARKNQAQGAIEDGDNGVKKETPVVEIGGAGGVQGCLGDQP